jgi:hypothetical protein
MIEVLCSFHAHDSGGVQYVNTLAVRSENSGLIGPETSLHDLLDGVDAWLTSKWLACLHPAYTADALRCYDISDPTVVAEKALSGAGTLPLPTGSHEWAPKEIALVLTLRTARGGRSYRGRMFIPSPRLGIFLLDNTNWDQSQTYWAKVGDLGSAITAGHDYEHGTELTPAHLSARVWSRTLGETNDVTSTLRRPQVHWLRSRATAP